jgi:hypothetical protein
MRDPRTGPKTRIPTGNRLAELPRPCSRRRAKGRVEFMLPISRETAPQLGRRAEARMQPTADSRLVPAALTGASLVSSGYRVEVLWQRLRRPQEALELAHGAIVGIVHAR